MTRQVRLLEKIRSSVEMSLADKYMITMGMIARNLAEHRGQCVVSFSGGKDSLLVLYLVRSLDSSIPVVFNNTGVEYPETVRFVRQTALDWGLRLVETTPDRTFWDCVRARGFFPKTKNNRSGGKGNICCYHLKEKPYLLAMRKYGWSCVFTGITASESGQRQMLAITHGMCYVTVNEGIRKVHPILYWTEDDVWEYTRGHSLPINPLYLRGADRVGCSVCTAYRAWEEQLSILNPKLYALVKQRMARLAQALGGGVV